MLHLRQDEAHVLAVHTTAARAEELGAGRHREGGLGVGLGLVMAPLGAVVLGSVPVAMSGAASAMHSQR